MFEEEESNVQSKLAICAIAISLSALPAAAVAEELAPANFKVVGSWAGLSPYKNFESKFWQEDLPAASNGRITGQISPVDTVGLKGFEVMRLLKLGVFDVAFGAIGYVAGDNPVIEGAALSSLSQDVDTTWELSRAYRAIIASEFEKAFNAKLLMMYAYSSNMFFCREPIGSLADIKGKKVRTYSTSLSDLVEGAGASGVTVAFAEMVPALEKGVVDCVLTGVMPAYNAKIGQVARHMYGLRVGWGESFAAMNLDTWNRLPEATRDFLRTQFAELETRMWEGTRNDEATGVACNTSGPCPLGEPAGISLVLPSPEDIELRNQLLKSSVLKRWIERCGVECAGPWNETVGRKLGLAIEH